MTGAELVSAMRRRALELGLRVGDFVAPLTPNPYAWLAQVERAESPKPHTVARVMALLNGQPVPEPPPNNFQSSPTHPRCGRNSPDRPGQPQEDQVVHRDPCFRCGARGDYGCGHRGAA